jgi:guanylate kinase
MGEKAAQALLVVLSAPSGAGKTTLGDNLLGKRKDIVRAVTCTTRAPRPGEEHGVHYYFFSMEEFNRRVDAGEFLEYADVYKNRYGTLKSEVLGKLRAGQDVLLTIDVQGAATVRQLAQTDPELARALVTVFLTPPSRQELEQRLNGRGTETPEVLARRLQEATRELEQAAYFDYLLLSETREKDLASLEEIIHAEHRRTKRLPLPAALKANP